MSVYCYSNNCTVFILILCCVNFRKSLNVKVKNESYPSYIKGSHDLCLSFVPFCWPWSCLPFWYLRMPYIHSIFLQSCSTYCYPTTWVVKLRLAPRVEDRDFDIRPNQIHQHCYLYIPIIVQPLGERFVSPETKCGCGKVAYHPVACCFHELAR